MIVCFDQCDYCRSSIFSEQRWVREKIYDPVSMAVIQATTATTLNPWPDRKEAVGKNTKWNGKLPE
jgi:hypothetical protein